MQKPAITPYTLLALALIGLGDTLYLSYYHYLNIVPTCVIKGCEIVLTSGYAQFFGVPVSYIGLVYYVYMFSLAILLAIEPRSFALRLGALVYTAIGFLYSVYAIFYVQLTLLGTICQFCALSALTTLLLFMTVVWHWRSSARFS